MEREPCTHFIKSGNTFALARWVKSRKHYRLAYYTPPAQGARLGAPTLSGTAFTVEQVHSMRRLKRKPTASQVRRAGW